LFPLFELSTVRAAPDGQQSEIDRPESELLEQPERVENLSTNDEASVGIGVHLADYFEGRTQNPYNNEDGFGLRVSATGNTRKGIEYQSVRYRSLIDWFDPAYMQPIGIVGDDDGKWIDIPFDVFFYGGPAPSGAHRSGCYNKVWVCSNGFVSFQDNLTSPIPLFGPTKPNAIIAPYWTDLYPAGGAIKYVSVGAPDFIFAIVWENVYNKLPAKGDRMISSVCTTGFGGSDKA
jgi:hypothetical protein